MLIINEQKFNALWASLRSFYGLILIVSGIDKFFNYLVNWNIYASPFVMTYFPMMITSNLMHIVAFIELSAGFLIITKWPRTGAYLAATWIGVIMCNCFSIGAYDIILRDLTIAVGYLAFGLLTELKEHVLQE